MSDTDRTADGNDEAKTASGVGWDGVPEGTSGAAAPGTQAAPDDREQVQPTGEGVEAAREQYRDQSERAQQSLRETGTRTIGDDGTT